MKEFILGSILLFAVLVFIPNNLRAYGECDQYGMWSMYNSYSNTCSCMVGYSFGKNFLGETYCVSDDEICRNQLGSNSRATYGGDCECSYGYVIDSSGRCSSGNSVCMLKLGLNSSYDSVSNSCECDDGYTLDDSGECVEKQNNAYFKVLDIHVDTKEALVKSEYDYSKYLIEYGYGCLDTSFERYVGKDIVVNLGTDYLVDRYDKIVLQNHDQVCDIKNRSKVYYDSFEEIYPSTQEETYYNNNSYVSDPLIITNDVNSFPDKDSDVEATASTQGEVLQKPEEKLRINFGEKIQKESFIQKIKNFFSSLFN